MSLVNEGLRSPDIEMVNHPRSGAIIRERPRGRTSSVGAGARRPPSACWTTTSAPRTPAHVYHRRNQLL